MQNIVDEIEAWVRFPKNFYDSFKIKKHASTQWHLINRLNQQTKLHFDQAYLNDLIGALVRIKNVNYYVPELLLDLQKKGIVRYVDSEGADFTPIGKALPASTTIHLTESFRWATNAYAMRFLSDTYGRPPTTESVHNPQRIIREVFEFHRHAYIWRWEQFVTSLSEAAYPSNPPVFEAELLGTLSLEYWLIIHKLWQHRLDPELAGTDPALKFKQILTLCNDVRYVEQDPLYNCLQYLSGCRVLEVDKRKHPRYVISNKYKDIFMDYIEPLRSIRHEFASRISGVLS